MEQVLSDFFKSNNIATTAKTVLAVSGGVDSVVMAHLFYEAKLPFVIAHCNFNLRGRESDEDERFVQELADKFGVNGYFQSFDTKDYAEKMSVSIQMAARELRYKWFEKLRTHLVFDYVATAHHKNDVAETILFKLTKGTGLKGITGIASIKGRLLRPLLNCTSNQVRKYANDQNIAWRTDSSNASTKYSRNKIRHNVLPELEKINPKAVEAIARSAKRVAEASQFLDNCLGSIHKKMVEKHRDYVKLNIAGIDALPGSMYVLFELIKPFGFTYLQAELILECSKKSYSGKLFYTANYVGNLDRNNLLITPSTEQVQPVYIGIKDRKIYHGRCGIEIKSLPNIDYKVPTGGTVLALDKDKLKFPLEIRHWAQGDTFVPLGMKGKKKLSDFMIDAKIPVNLKKQVRVVVSDNKIVGILNHRPDERYKITNRTKSVLEIKCS